MNNVIERLNLRGLLQDMTTPELAKLLEKPAVIYAGFDPTSESLQAGNYVTIMAMAHFQRCGHRVIALVGGATGLIGDPSGKESERAMLSEEQVRRNVEGIRENLSRFLDFNHPTAPAIVVNNYDWLSRFSYVAFLRDVGKHFRLGQMLGKDSVRTRMEGEGGMSYTEFSYQLMQAYDFMHLYEQHGCTVQIGGSDQWGNITAGIELIRRLKGVETHGMTIPLVCDSAGRKFGKSEGNAVYLDARRTSVFNFYQFFLRSEDVDVIRYLKIFTFLPLEEIAELELRLKAEPEKRVPQLRLAEEVTRAVHGEAGLAAARRASDVLYGGDVAGLGADELLEIFADVPSTQLSRAVVQGARVADVAGATPLCGSKGAARRLITGGGMYVNNRRITDEAAVVAESDIIDGRVLVLRSGKRNFHLVKIF